MFETLQWLWLVKIAAGIALYVVVPGMFVLRFVQPNVTGTHRAALSFALGYVLFANIAIVALPFNASFEVMNIAFGVIATAAVIISIPNRSTKFNVRLSESTVFMATAAACGFGLSLLSGWFPRGDASVHLQSINNLVQDGRVMEARYSLVDHPAIPDQGFNAQHLLVALISRNFGLAPDVTWHYLSPVIALFVPSTVILLVSAVAIEKRLQFYTLTSFLVLAFLFPLIIQGTVFDALVYPNRIYLWIAIPSAMYFLFRYYEHGAAGSIALIVAHVVAFFAVHVEGFLWLVVVTFGVALLAFPFKRTFIHVPASRSVVAILAVLLSAAPFLIWRSEANAAFIEKVTNPIWLEHYSAWRVHDHFYALNPTRLGWVSVAVGVAALFAFAAYMAVNYYGRTILITERKFVLLLAVSFLPLLLVFNPILFPTAMGVLGIVPLNRMQRIPLHYFAMGAAFFLVAPAGKRVRGLAWNYQYIGTVVVVLSFLLAVGRIPMPSIDHQVLWTKAFLPYLSRQSLVLADPVTSSDVASMTPATVLSIRFNGAVELRDLSKEKEAIEAFFAGDQATARRVLETFEPTHVVAQAGEQKLAAMTYPFLHIVMDTPEGSLFRVELR